MKKIIVSLLIALLVMLVPTQVAADTQCFESYTGEGDSFSCAWDNYWLSQTFTPVTAHKITSVKIPLCRWGLPGDIVVSIRNTNDIGLPTGDDLCSGITDGSTLPHAWSNKYEWRVITLGSGHDLASNIQYAIVLRVPGEDVNNYVRWLRDYYPNPPSYAGGRGLWSPNSGAIWIDRPTLDFKFEECGELLDEPMSDCLSSFSVWWEGEGNWKLVIEPIELPSDTDIWYAIGWVNTTEETQIGHIEALVVSSNSAGERTQTYVGQDTSRAPNSGHTVGFLPFHTSQSGTYTIFGSLSYSSGLQDTLPLEMYVDSNSGQYFNFSADVVDCDFISKNYFSAGQVCDWEVNPEYDEWYTSPYTAQRDLDFDGDVDSTDYTHFSNTPRFALPIVEQIKTGAYQTLTWEGTSVLLAACDPSYVDLFTGRDSGDVDGWISVRLHAYDVDNYNCASFTADTVVAAYKTMGYGCFLYAYNDVPHKFVMFWKGGNWQQLSNWGVINSETGAVMVNASSVSDDYQADGIVFPTTGEAGERTFSGRVLAVNYGAGTVSYSGIDGFCDQSHEEPVPATFDCFRGNGVD